MEVAASGGQCNGMKNSRDVGYADKIRNDVVVVRSVESVPMQTRFARIKNGTAPVWTRRTPHSIHDYPDEKQSKEAFLD